MREKQGDVRYPIPHHLFSGNFKCREFSSSNNPIGDPFEGDFIVRAILIEGRSKKVIKLLEEKSAAHKEKIGFFEKRDIQRKFAEEQGKHIIEKVWLVEHIHIAPRRS